jgi:hypothetical protein
LCERVRLGERVLSQGSRASMSKLKIETSSVHDTKGCRRHNPYTQAAPDIWPLDDHRDIRYRFIYIIHRYSLIV